MIREDYETIGNIDNNSTFTCEEINVIDGFCPYCGEKLIKLYTPEPYSEGTTYRAEVTCSNPDCY